VREEAKEEEKRRMERFMENKPVAAAAAAAAPPGRLESVKAAEKARKVEERKLKEAEGRLLAQDAKERRESNYRRIAEEERSHWGGSPAKEGSPPGSPESIKQALWLVGLETTKAEVDDLEKKLARRERRG